MKKYEGQKTYMLVNGVFHILSVLILSLLIYSLPVYGSTDIPVKVNTTPVALGAASLFTGFGGVAGINQAILNVADEDMGTRAASTMVTGFHVYTDTISNKGTVNGSIQTAPPCEDICILSM